VFRVTITLDQCPEHDFYQRKGEAKIFLWCQGDQGRSPRTTGAREHRRPRNGVDAKIGGDIWRLIGIVVVGARKVTGRGTEINLDASKPARPPGAGP